MKIASIIGARPQFVKEMPILREIRKNHSEIIIHSGQHYDYEMSKIFFQDLDIPKPDYNLNVGSGTHGKQTGEMLIRLEKVLLKEKPDLVIISGDTNTTLAGAIAASKLNIRLAHVEAGMRNFDRTVPEEINRILADHVSDILFCSSSASASNLSREGITKNVHIVGDVMIDAIKSSIKIAEKKSGILKKLKLKSRDYLVATVHRAGNTDKKENLREIIGAFIQSGEKIVFPLHPRTEKFLKLYGIDKKIKNTNITITKPLGYMDMLVLEKNARKILTDSGGVQKEACFFNVPCITLLDATEWVETAEKGFNVLTGANRKKILHSIGNFEIRRKYGGIYGNGDAAKKIADVLAE
jgi:UDP-N-acetylglucosamine 2-epimerase (non-hydrolysing)